MAMTRRTQLTGDWRKRNTTVGALWTAAVVVLVVVAPACLGQLRVNYCYSNLCPPGEGHVDCTETGGFGRDCNQRYARVVPMTPARKSAILQQHNLQRQWIATGGGLPLYQPAYRMPQLYWDDDLQRLAELNARSCVYAHDHCRNTPSFPKAGQNIAIIRHFGLNLTKDAVIQYIIQHWFDEYKLPSVPSFVDRYPTNYYGPDFAHFTQIVNDRATRMACGMVTWQTYNGYVVTNDYLVCNYEYSNVIGDRSYTKGQAGAGCVSGPSDQYAGLCKWK